VGRRVTYALLLIVVTTTIVWGLSNYFIKPLPSIINNYIQIATAIIAGLAGLNEITDLVGKVAAYKMDRLPPVSSDEEKRSRKHLLNIVNKYWIKGVFENSLFGAVLMELGMQYQPEAVVYPLSLIAENLDKVQTCIAPQTSLLDIFNQANNELLIIGDPGSGKTTIMLALAKELLSIASKDNSHPAPVILNLSSWSVSQESLPDWVIDELTQRYRIRKEVAIKWIYTGSLTLMLDGLDEVNNELRDRCVEKINHYLHSRGAIHIVVCSRQFEYMALKHRLELDTAIKIQPLSNNQIFEFLGKLGKELNYVKKAIKEDEILFELAQSPLMLNIMLLVSRDMSTQNLDKSLTIEKRRKQIFNSYVKKVITRKAEAYGYEVDKSIKWLTWLAKNMHEHSITIFQMEEIQPSWVSNLVNAKVFYRLDVLTKSVISGFVVVIISSLLGAPIFSFPVNIWFGLIVGTLSIFMGLVELFAIDKEAIYPKAHQRKPARSCALSLTILVGPIALALSCLALVARNITFTIYSLLIIVLVCQN